MNKSIKYYVLLSSAALAGLLVGGYGISAKADQTVVPTGDTENMSTEAPSNIASLSSKTSTTSVADTTVASTHKIVTVTSGDNQTRLTNQLLLDTSTDDTLKSVKVDNGSYDKDNNIATINSPQSASSVTAVYGKVGTYNSAPISASVSLDGILLHDTQHVTPKIKLPSGQTQSVAGTDGAIIFGKSFGQGIDTYNIADDTLHVKFFYLDGSPVDLTGESYITIGSLNGPTTKLAGNEYVDYLSDDLAYVTEKTVLAPMTNPNTNQGVVLSGKTNDFTDVLGAPTSENGAVTFKVSGNELKFVNGTTRYDLGGDGHWTHTVMNLSSATVAPAVIPTPVLSVDKTSALAGDSVKYTLAQKVNTLGEDTLLRYGDWSQVMNLPTQVKYQSAQLLDGSGKVIDSAVITNNDANHTVSVSLPEAFLNTMALQGETYQLVINTKVNDDVVVAQEGSASGVDTIDSNQLKANNVSTTFGIVAQPVTVRYFSPKGKLRSSEIITGLYGQTYKVVGKEPHSENGYTLDKTKLPKNATGTFGSNTTFVDFYYAGPKDTWTSLPHDLAINRVVDGDNTLMTLDVYYPDGSKLSLVKQPDGSIKGHAINPDGYSSKEFILNGNNLSVIVGKNGIKADWFNEVSLSPDGGLKIEYTGGKAQISLKLDPSMQVVKQQYVELSKSKVGPNIDGGDSNTQELGGRSQNSYQGNVNGKSPIGAHKQLRGLIDKKVRTNQLLTRLPETDEQETATSFLGIMASLIISITSLLFLRRKENEKN